MLVERLAPAGMARRGLELLGELVVLVFALVTLWQAAEYAIGQTIHLDGGLSTGNRRDRPTSLESRAGAAQKGVSDDDRT